MISHIEIIPLDSKVVFELKFPDESMYEHESGQLFY